MIRRLLPLALLAGCAAPAPGAVQTVSIGSDPPAASCTVSRGGGVLGTVDPTPGTLSVTQSDKELTVTCRKRGWQPGTGTLAALYRSPGFGRIVSGGLAGVVEDAAKSDDFYYDSSGFVVRLTR